MPVFVMCIVNLFIDNNELSVCLPVCKNKFAIVMIQYIREYILFKTMNEQTNCILQLIRLRFRFQFNFYVY